MENQTSIRFSEYEISGLKQSMEAVLQRQSRKTSLELFSGSGTISSALRVSGFKTYTLDIIKTAGFENTHIQNSILNVSIEELQKINPAIIWASIPCTAFSIASGRKYFLNKTFHRKNADEFIAITLRTFEIIEAINPQLWFIENPRGRLRYQPELRDFLHRNKGVIKELTYSSYGYPSRKATDIFTNAINYTPLALSSKIGKGKAKKYKSFDYISKSSRAKIPDKLALEIASFCHNSQKGVEIFC